MYLYFYISKANGLHNLSKILLSAKRSNSRNGITGLMSYNKGYYLQIIEGGDDAVKELANRIKADKRHHRFHTIISMPIERRFFPNWSMKLVPLLSRNRQFQAFMLEMDEHLENLSSRKHALTEVFHRYHRYSYPTKPVFAKTWESTVFSVNQWPNFNEMRPTPELMSLCSALFNNSMSYSELIVGDYYKSENELKKQLKELMAIECLTTSTISRSDEMLDAHPVGDMENLGFIHKMRDFISNRLH